MENKHHWQLLRHEPGVIHKSSCVNCLLLKIEQDRGEGWLTTYSGGMSSYRHVPPCTGNLLEHHTLEDREGASSPLSFVYTAVNSRFAPPIRRGVIEWERRYICDGI